MDLSGHNVRKIVAEVNHGEDTSWIVLTVHERWRSWPVETTAITLFIAGPDAESKANAYAAAINSVNDLYPEPELKSEPETETEAELEMCF